MKGLLICRDSAAAAFAAILPEQHPWLLPVAGKPVIAYQLETLARMGINEVLLLGAGPLIARHFGDGEGLGMRLDYAPAPGKAGLPALIQRNAGWIAEAPLVVIEGLRICAPNHDRHCLRLERSCRLGKGVLALLPPERGLNAVALEALPELDWIDSLSISDVTRWLELQAEVQPRWQGRISWPAYGRQGDFLLGGRVEYGTGELAGCGLIGDNSLIARDVRLEQVWMGRDCVIAPGSSLKRCIVLDNSYVGAGLQLENKIVAGPYLIDGQTGHRVPLADAAWFDGLPQQVMVSWALRALAFGLWLLQTLLIALLRPHFQLGRFRLGGRFQDFPLPAAGKGLRQRLARRLRLELCPRWREVGLGRMAPIGQPLVPWDQPLPYAVYAPGAVAFSEFCGSVGLQARLDDGCVPLLGSWSTYQQFGMLGKILLRSLTAGAVIVQTDASPADDREVFAGEAPVLTGVAGE